MNHNSPELSIVVTARNDDHGGSFIHRMQLFITGLLEQARRFRLNSELIIVEWNPPPDRARLEEAFNWPHDVGPCSVRIIEVPPEIHQRYRYSDRLRLYQMIAKNVGIRRARGHFVLATNVDLLFSDELIEFMATGNMKRQFIYRVDRYDVPSSIPADIPVKEQIEYCKRHVIRVNYRDGSFTETSGQPPLPRLQFTIPPGLYLAYAQMRKRIWRSRERPLVPTGLRYRRLVFQPPYPRLHTNACGDFTMLSKEDWFTIRGYPELEMYSLHIDSLLLYMAYNQGFLEMHLPDPMRIYHIEHSSMGWTPEGALTIKERMKGLGIPTLSWDQVESWLVRMYRDRRPQIFNSETWGLENENLPETRVF